MASPVTFYKNEKFNQGFSQQPFDKIQELLKDNKNDIKESYEVRLIQAFDLFCQIDNPLGYPLSYPILGTLLNHYGFQRHDDSFSACMALMRASLNAQFVMCGLQYGLCFDIKNIKSFSDVENLDNEIFNGFDEYILTSDMKAIGQKINNCNLSWENLTLMLTTVLWLTLSLKNTPGYGEDEKGKEEVNRKRIDQLTALSKEIDSLAGK